MMLGVGGATSRSTTMVHLLPSPTSRMGAAPQQLHLPSIHVLGADSESEGQTTACATMMRAPSNAAAGEPYSRYPSARASLTLLQNSASSGPVRRR